MIIKQTFSAPSSACVFFGIAISLFLSIGCEKPNDSGGKNTVGKSKLPKLYLHCPDDFEPSVVRLREVHDAIFSDEKLPEPTICNVVEIIHGEGHGAHSHYYLAGSDQDPGHHHEDVPSDEKYHEIPIDVFTEFRDIAWVLPNVAADSDMGEKAWLKVKAASREMVELIDSAIQNDLSDEEKRTTLQNSKEKFAELLSQLESQITPASDRENSDDQKE